MASSSSLLTVIVYAPGRFAVKLPISPFAEVSELRSHINLGSSIFVWKGQLLLDRMTFAFYRICQMDVIVAVPGPVLEAEKWTKVTEEAEAFQERVHFILNAGTALELARLRDLRHLRADAQGIGLRRPTTAWTGRAESPPSPPLTIDYRAPDHPSCDPLPAEWMPEPVL
jgi:hypothetical protein